MDSSPKNSKPGVPNQNVSTTQATRNFESEPEARNVPVVNDQNTQSPRIPIQTATGVTLADSPRSLFSYAHLHDQAHSAGNYLVGDSTSPDMHRSSSGTRPISGPGTPSSRAARNTSDSLSSSSPHTSTPAQLNPPIHITHSQSAQSDPQPAPSNSTPDQSTQINSQDTDTVMSNAPNPSNNQITPPNQMIPTDTEPPSAPLSSSHRGFRATLEASPSPLQRTSNQSITYLGPSFALNSGSRGTSINSPRESHIWATGRTSARSSRINSNPADNMTRNSPGPSSQPNPPSTTTTHPPSHAQHQRPPSQRNLPFWVPPQRARNEHYASDDDEDMGDENDKENTSKAATKSKAKKNDMPSCDTPKDRFNQKRGPPGGDGGGFGSGSDYRNYPDGFRFRNATSGGDGDQRGSGGDGGGNGGRNRGVDRHGLNGVNQESASTGALSSSSASSSDRDFSYSQSSPTNQNPHNPPPGNHESPPSSPPFILSPRFSTSSPPTRELHPHQIEHYDETQSPNKQQNNALVGHQVEEFSWVLPMDGLEPGFLLFDLGWEQLQEGDKIGDWKMLMRKTNLLTHEEVTGNLGVLHENREDGDVDVINQDDDGHGERKGCGEVMSNGSDHSCYFRFKTMVEPTTLDGLEDVLSGFENTDDLSEGSGHSYYFEKETGRSGRNLDDGNAFSKGRIHRAHFHSIPQESIENSCGSHEKAGFGAMEEVD